MYMIATYKDIITSTCRHLERLHPYDIHYFYLGAQRICVLVDRVRVCVCECVCEREK